LRIGKLTDEQLESLVLSRLPQLSSKTLSGAGIGADCAWLKTGENLLVTSSDPITAGGSESGTLAIHVSCNDIAACGVQPTGILIVIIAPPSATEEEIVSIVDQASREAGKLGVDIVGGHTEVSDCVNRFVVISTAFGVVEKGSPVPLGHAKPGDKLLITKTGAIEGSFIAANEHQDKLEGNPDRLEGSAPSTASFAEEAALTPRSSAHFLQASGKTSKHHASDGLITPPLTNPPRRALPILPVPITANLIEYLLK